MNSRMRRSQPDREQEEYMRVEIRGDNVNIAEDTRQLIERKCRLALGRIVSEIGDVRVLVRDENGPKQGVDQCCSVAIRFRRGAEIHAEATDATLQNAVDRALTRAARSALRVIARNQEYDRDSIRFGTPAGTY
jgi:ribosomal subunit interface protein